MKRLTVLVAVAVAALAGTAMAHQTAYSNGARVTMHVSPEDSPDSGSPATVTVTKVGVPKGAKFSFRSCGCRLKVTDSGGAVVIDRAMRRQTKVTFPRAGAYRLVYSGSYRKSGKRKKFAAAFSIRAN
jgi:hypothetical protein